MRTEIKLVANSIALAALVMVTAGPSNAEQLKPTSIPSSFAEYENTLMPLVMDEFYGSYNKDKSCWMGKHKDGEFEDLYCMKPIRLDVRSSNGRKLLFIVAGGHKVDEEGNLVGGHGTSGGLGLIVLTPGGATLGVLATNNLYEWFATYNRIPEYDTVTIHQIGPNGTYGWVVNSGEDHSGREYRWAKIYGVVGDAVEPLTTITSYFSNGGGGGGCGPEEHCTLSVDYAFDIRSSTTPFYPIKLVASGIKNNRAFRANYRLPFNKEAFTYLAPSNMPDEIKPAPFIALPEPGTLSLSCKGTQTFGSGNKDPVWIGIVVNFTTETVQFALGAEPITGLDDATVAFGQENGFNGTIDRATGETEIKSAGSDTYSLHCRTVQ